LRWSTAADGSSAIGPVPEICVVAASMGCGERSDPPDDEVVMSGSVWSGVVTDSGGC
jgi:hypothetical protein